MATFLLLVWHLCCCITKIFTKTKFGGEDVFVGDQCTKAEWYLHFERYICHILIICIIILLVNLDNAALHVIVSTLAFILPRLKERTNQDSADLLLTLFLFQ